MLSRQLSITPWGGFQDQSFADFRVKNTPFKDVNGKGNLKWTLSFLVVDYRKLLATKLFVEEFNDVFFTAESNSKCSVQWNCWFARDVRAAMLVVKNKSISLHWQLKSISHKFFWEKFYCIDLQRSRLVRWLQAINSTKAAQFLQTF